MMMILPQFLVVVEPHFHIPEVCTQASDMAFKVSLDADE